MSKDVLELEDAGELLKLYDGNEKGEIVCITHFSEEDPKLNRVRVTLAITAEPTSTNILVRIVEFIDEYDLPVVNTKEFEELNLKRKQRIADVKAVVEKRKADYLKQFEAKGFRVLYGAWTI